MSGCASRLPRPKRACVPVSHAGTHQKGGPAAQACQALTSGNPGLLGIIRIASRKRLNPVSRFTVYSLYCGELASHLRGVFGETGAERKNIRPPKKYGACRPDKGLRQYTQWVYWRRPSPGKENVTYSLYNIENR